MYDVLCYGSISLDVSGRLKKPWHCLGQAEAVDYLLSPGGDATLVALTLAGMGLRVALAGGPVGGDPLGVYLRAALNQAGVDLYVKSGGKTSLTAITVDLSGNRSTVTYHENTPLEDITVPADIIRQARFLYADGCYGPRSAMAGEEARKAGLLSLLNLDHPAMGYIGLFDTVIASEVMARSISPDPVKAAEAIRSRGAKLAIVTIGDGGSIAFENGPVVFPACPVKVIDSTGAGAAFTAGLIYARLNGYSLTDCLRLASAAGAYKCMVRGSYRRFSIEELQNFLDSLK